MQEIDTMWMQLALEQAHLAAAKGEVPVGAVLVRHQELLARGHNQPIQSHDPSAHAEIQVLRAAGLSEQNYRLPGTTLYVSLEPCLMCLGAILHARVERLVYAASDTRLGAVNQVLDSDLVTRCNHRLVYTAGVCAQEAGLILKQFFLLRRVK